MSEDDFLRRWSRRKIQARKGEAPEEPAKPVEPQAALSPGATAIPPSAPEPPPLPPIESLTPESDFAPFMKPQVDGGLRSQALKTLFKDPRFNVMDGLDVYIDDYSKPDPLPPGWLEKMTQVARLGAYEPPAEPENAPECADGATAAEEPQAADVPSPPPGDEMPEASRDDDMKPTS